MEVSKCFEREIAGIEESGQTVREEAYQKFVERLEDQLTVKVDYASPGQILRSFPKVAEFGFEGGHSYQVAFRYDRQRHTVTSEGTLNEGVWEIALYDTTEKCVFVEGSPMCHPETVAPWVSRGWGWSP